MQPLSESLDAASLSWIRLSGWRSLMDGWDGIAYRRAGRYRPKLRHAFDKLAATARSCATDLYPITVVELAFGTVALPHIARLEFIHQPHTIAPIGAFHSSSTVDPDLLTVGRGLFKNSADFVFS